jgi:putative transposase
LWHLRPASPELNRTENIWQYMRQSYLSNRVFRDYDDVVEASRSAWNKLVGTGADRIDRYAMLDNQ